MPSNMLPRTELPLKPNIHTKLPIKLALINQPQVHSKTLLSKMSPQTLKLPCLLLLLFNQLQLPLKPIPQHSNYMPVVF